LAATALAASVCAFGDLLAQIRIDALLRHGLGVEYQDCPSTRAQVSAEDQGVLRTYLTRRKTAGTPEELGLIPWEQAEAELDAREGA